MKIVEGSLSVNPWARKMRFFSPNLDILKTCSSREHIFWTTLGPAHLFKSKTVIIKQRLKKKKPFKTVYLSAAIDADIKRPPTMLSVDSDLHPNPSHWSRKWIRFHFNYPISNSFLYSIGLMFVQIPATLFFLCLTHSVHSSVPLF